MTSPVWQTSAGFLGTLTERDPAFVTVAASGAGITYTVISGSLPTGLILDAQAGIISGTPASVARVTNSVFVIRASNTDGLNDRTFSLDIFGPSAPIWDTPVGALPVGPNGEQYTLNKEWVDYTVRAETDALISGSKLRYYIAFNAGQLPPGLTLTEDGRIYGIVDDQLQLDTLASVSGGYDKERYDAYPFDHSASSSGSSAKPESINKIYQFTITVTDTVVSATRTFTINVNDPNSLRVDNSIIHVDTDSYLTSVGYLLPPLWQNKLGENLTKISNLGVMRASRDQIITLYDYDPYPFVGPVRYDWSTLVNPEIPLVADSQIGNQQLNVHAKPGQATTNLRNQNQVYFKNVAVLPTKDMYLNLSDYVTAADPTTYLITGVVVTTSTVVITNLGTATHYSGYINLDQPLKNTIPDSTNIFVGSPSQHPAGMQLDGAAGQLYGQIPYQPAYSKSYRFTIKLIKTDTATGNTISNSQIFILTVKGDVENTIQWISTSSLGVLIPGQTSELAVKAVNTNTTYSLEYKLMSGSLPQGLTLYPDGTVQGQAITQASTGTSIYNFVVQANDVYLLSAIQQNFTITVDQETLNQYTQIYLRPFLPVDQRLSYRSFTGDAALFNPSVLYRPNDPNFGVQSSIKMVIETGIQAVNPAEYILQIQNYLGRKRFYFGDVKSVVAQDSSRTPVYELIYVDIIDNQMSGSVSAESFVYGDGSTYYPITVGAMQAALESIIIDDTTPIDLAENLQPRYMSTIQPVTGLKLGFIKAVPICYALPGESAKIISLIKSSGFDFKNYNFDTDRIVIENNTTTNQTTWITYPIDIFPNELILTDEYGNVLTNQNEDPLEGN